MFAVQLAVLPPFKPAQLQVQGPEPETDEAEPAEQMLTPVGNEYKFCPFTPDEHTPLTFNGAVHVGEVDPPFKPEQVQVHGPLPETEEAEPELQKLEVGAVYVFTVAEPQVPSTFIKTLQFAEEPPFKPLQVQDHGPEPLKPVTVPAS
ncbi:MAG: hypothetical protein WC408_04055, partial [Candidatus Micrarchaeia archaeon]